MFNDLTYCRHRETSHRHFTEGGVVVVRGDAVLRGVAKDLRDVLVAVVRIEEVEAPVLGTHGQGPRGDGFRRVPVRTALPCVVGIATTPSVKYLALTVTCVSLRAYGGRLSHPAPSRQATNAGRDVLW